MQAKNTVTFLKFTVFLAGSASDPRPLENEFSKRFARDLTHNVIVHFSGVLRKWTADNGTFHNSGCELEFPKAWLPDPIANELALTKARSLSLEGPC